MVGIEFFVVDFFKAFDMFIFLNEVNETICVRFEVDDVFAKSTNLLGFNLFLSFYQKF